MQQIYWVDVLVAVTSLSIRFLSVIDSFCGANMDTPKAIHATMLPDGMPLGAQYVLGGADALTKPAGDTEFCIAEKLFVKLLLP